jgi:predicted enzyme related to lactoylglutathione lyase
VVDLKLYGVRLRITDSSAPYRFYRDAMGLTSRAGREGEEFALFLDSEGTGVELVSHREDAAAHGGDSATPQGGDSAIAADHTTLIFDTTNVHDKLRALREWGAEVVTEPTDIVPLGVRVARLRDPAGNLIELRQKLS